MTKPTELSLDGNPFASHRTRPGAIEFCFPDGMTADSLVNRLSEHNWRGQIVGLHGAGKSTLVAALLPELHRHGLSTRVIALHDGQRRLPVDFFEAHEPGGQLVLVVDGYEQLSFVERLKLRWHCRRRGRGLLITTHVRAIQLPALITLAPDTQLLLHLWRELVAGSPPLVSDYDASISFSRHGGNLREVWFDLYDQYERNRRTQGAVSQSQ